MITLTIITLLLLNLAQRGTIKKAIAKNDESGRLQLESMGRRNMFITKKNREMVFNYLADVTQKTHRTTESEIKYIEKQASEFPELYYVEIKVGRSIKQIKVDAKSFEEAKYIIKQRFREPILRITKVMK